MNEFKFLDKLLLKTFCVFNKLHDCKFTWIFVCSESSVQKSKDDTDTLYDKKLHYIYCFVHKKMSESILLGISLYSMVDLKILEAKTCWIFGFLKIIISTSTWHEKTACKKIIPKLFIKNLTSKFHSISFHIFKIQMKQRMNWKQAYH